MNRVIPSSSGNPWIPRHPLILVSFLIVGLCSAQAGADQVYQIPLAVGTDVPGNLLLVPSVEFPTVDSVANVDSSYDEDKEYVGYFDPDKCYKYEYAGSGTNHAGSDENHFYPSSITTDHRCTGDDEWSGNYLDWAVTQTIDPFRKALTGGYRVRDTDSETWLQKARSDSNSNESTYYPARTLKNSKVIAGATPFNASSLTVHVSQYGNRMLFVPTNYSYQGGETTASVFDDSGSGYWTDSNSIISSSTKKYHSTNSSLKVSPYSSSNWWVTATSAYASLEENISDLNFTFSGWLYSGDQNNTMTLSLGSYGSGYGVRFTSSKISIVSTSTYNPSSQTEIASKAVSFPVDEWFRFELTATTSGFTLEVYDSDGDEIALISTSKTSSLTSFSHVYVFSTTTNSTWYADDLLVKTETQVIPFDGIYSNSQFYANVRVKVCDPEVGLEDNCVQYGDHYKPEGLLQEYANDIRVGVFGYLNISDTSKNGGVLRSRLHFIGDTKINTDGSEEENENMEWDPDTGILVQNPDPNDASDTDTGSVPIEYSGVINYINDFGELTTGTHKSYDPVSELYYAAIRYYRGLDNVRNFSDFTATTDDGKYSQADGFPVITDWQASDKETGSIQYYCQKSSILGIGDVYTWNDGNLPGGNYPPSEISGDTPPNVGAVTQKVLSLQGVSYSGNSTAYIAGLAYYWHTNDMRPDDDFDGDQTVTTYWVDVQEGQKTRNPSNNQYYLATKFGGFEVPDGFKPMADTTTSLDDDWWDSGDTFTAEDGKTYQTPSNYFLAGDAAKMIASLEEAFESIVGETTGSASSVAANSTSLEQGTVVYQARYASDHWDGDLRAYLVDASTGEVADDYKWSAMEEMPEAAARAIYVHNPDGSGADSEFTDFVWDNLSADQQVALGSEAVVDYLRGDDSESGYRERDGLLGDIVHSSPVYSGGATASLYKTSTFSGASDWSEYVTETAERTPMVYVGANDGMLHAFRADTGKELFAFVPNVSILARGGIENSMSALTETDYSHFYYVDGELTVADAYVNGAWKTVLVGTLGYGGPGVFALDVTNPASPRFLWEKNATDIPALGRNLGKPVIAQVADGDWRVILGNGPDSETGHAQLIMIGVESGDVTVVDTGVGGTDEEDLNGLSAAYTWDTDGDGFIDALYAGDLQGNLWKFTDLAGSVPAAEDLFIATDPDGDTQPITAAPLVGEDTDTDTLWVFFGTGQYLDKNDISDKQVQTWYGIKDEGNGSTVTRSGLAEREIEYELTVNDTGVRVITQEEENGVDDIDDFSGWRIDLISPVNDEEGERMVVPNSFKGTTLVGTTRIPESDDSCEVGGKSWVMAISPFTGTALASSFFDVSGDSEINSKDTITINGTTHVVSGIGFSSGSNGSTFVGNAMEVSLDDASVATVMTSSASTDAERTSWHEVLE